MANTKKYFKRIRRKESMGLEREVIVNISLSLHSMQACLGFAHPFLAIQITTWKIKLLKKLISLVGRFVETLNLCIVGVKYWGIEGGKRSFCQPSFLVCSTPFLILSEEFFLSSLNSSTFSLPRLEGSWVQRIQTSTFSFS